MIVILPSGPAGQRRVCGAVHAGPASPDPRDDAQAAEAYSSKYPL